MSIGSNKNVYTIEIDDKNIFYNSSEIINQVAQMKNFSCKCDCDKLKNKLLETTTSQYYVNDKNVDYDLDLNIDSSSNSNLQIPVIFVITPTYMRPTQMADMTRLAQTLMLIKNIFWVVSEDSTKPNTQVSSLLNRTGIPHVHLLGPRPNTHLDKRSGRGVSNRLRALKWLRETYTNTNQQGVIYFADDDNAYDIRIFDEIRDTKKISVFPVGLIAKIGLSTPILSSKDGKIIGFHDPFIGRRKFAIDMAGFAVNLQLFLRKTKATMPYKVGYEEDYFIKSLEVPLDQFEPKAAKCTQVIFN